MSLIPLSFQATRDVAHDDRKTNACMVVVRTDAEHVAVGPAALIEFCAFQPNFHFLAPSAVQTPAMVEGASGVANGLSVSLASLTGCAPNSEVAA